MQGLAAKTHEGVQLKRRHKKKKKKEEEADEEPVEEKPKEEEPKEKEKPEEPSDEDTEGDEESDEDSECAEDDEECLAEKEAEKEEEEEDANYQIECDPEALDYEDCVAEQEAESQYEDTVETYEEKEARINSIGGELFWHRDKYYLNLKNQCGVWIRKGGSYRDGTKRKKDKFYVFGKLRWDPITHKPDFNDHTYATKFDEVELDQGCSLEGLHFNWQTGKKEEDNDFLFIHPEVEYFASQFDFVTKHAPLLWLNEDEEKGWFPSDLDFHLAQTKPATKD